MAAQVKTNICSRCFAQVREDDQVCPECGAPLKGETLTPGIDSAMHTELAQANLLRLRGERDAAEKQCLSILKRYPNEPEAHSLLGELAAEKGDTQRAIEWFELALDLNPNSTTDRARLEELTTKAQNTDNAHIEEILSLNEKPNYVAFGAIGVFIVAVLAIVFYAATHSRSNPIAKPLPSLQANVIAPTTGKPDGETAQSSADGDTGSSQAPGETSVPAPATAQGLPVISVDDRALFQLLQQRSTEGPKLVNLQQDPRDKALSLTYQVSNPEEARLVGAILAKDALIQSTDSLNITVRCLSGEKLIFAADASRPRLTEVQSQFQANGQPPKDEAWIGTFLQREWSANGQVPSQNGGVAPSQTTTGTEPATTGLESGSPSR